MDYLEFDISIDPKIPGADILIAELAEKGFESFTETEKGFLAYIQEELFNKDDFDSISLLNNKDFKIEWIKKNIPSQNWNTEWESNFEPIIIEGSCCIRAPFHPVPDNIKYDIIIEPKMSFGTGHHFTTSLMIRKLLTLNISQSALLDMGCGTGVLAILASKLGAGPVTAIDTDEWAYKNTLENILINNTENIIVNKGNAELLAGKLFNIILANINRNVLLNDIKTYALSLLDNGNLVLSVFFETDIPVIINEAEKHNLELKHRQIDSTWAFIAFY